MTILWVLKSKGRHIKKCFCSFNNLPTSCFMPEVVSCYLDWFADHLYVFLRLISLAYFMFLRLILMNGFLFLRLILLTGFFFLLAVTERAFRWNSSVLNSLLKTIFPLVYLAKDWVLQSSSTTWLSSRALD